MSKYAHKGQILPITNQMIPIDKETTFHASYDYDLNGFNQGEMVYPAGQTLAMNFPGATGDYIEVANNSDINITGSLTVEFWLNVAAAPTAGEVNMIDKNGYTQYRIGLITSGAIHTTIRTTDGVTPTYDNGYGTAFTPTIGQWYHIAYVFNSSAKTISLYVDGALHSSRASTHGAIVPSSANLMIGRYAANTQNFKGALQDVRIWNTARTQLEIAEWMNRELAGDESGLVAYWKLTEREGAVVHDSSIKQNNGIKRGAVTSVYGRTVATLKKEEGKFRGAVLIEPDTVNLVPEGMRTCSSPLTQQSSAAYSLEKSVEGRADVLRIKVMGTAGNDLYAIFGIHNVMTAAVGDVVTISFEYKIIQGVGAPSIGTVYADGFKLPTTSNVGAFGPVTIEEMENGWQRYSRNVTINTAGNSWFRWNYFSEEQTAEVVLDNFQIERRDAPTTFVDGNRPLGKLWYPKELINPSSFTLSCWFNIPHMHRVATNNGGINTNWFHPIIEVATSTTNSQSFGLVAGPEPSSYSRKLTLQSPVSGVSTFPVQDNTWYHMVTTYDGTTYKVYIDGVERISAAGAPMVLAEGQHLMVGGGYRGKPNIMVDELRIESRAISLEEVEAWAASGLHYNYLDYSQHVD